MGKKIFLNVVYNIGIFLCLITGWWGYTNKRYEYIVVGILIAVVFVVLKARLIKEVRGLKK